MKLSKPKLIDVHAHICDPGFDKDRAEVLERARKACVDAIIAVGENLADASKNLELVKQLPLTCLLVESDSPVLGPSPEERNEPVNILQSIKAIAALKDVAEEEVVAAVSENTEKLYGKLV